MFEEYIQGATTQLIERASALKEEIPRPPKLEFQALASRCCRDIDDAIRDLQAVRDDPAWRKPEHTAIRLLEFRRISSLVDRVEIEAIAAMARSSLKEGVINRLLYRMTGEINYPIELPTISLLSQNYFYVNTNFNLLCMPLTELHYLLHLPDIYHELAHPFFRAENDPRIKNWLGAFFRAVETIDSHLASQILEAENSRSPDIIRFALSAAQGRWKCRWGEEIFCDLFGLFATGPAFAWAHLHLYAQSGSNAFQLPTRGSTHPADASRMTALLEGLHVINESDAAGQIENKWHRLLTCAGQFEPPEFQRYYPNSILRKFAEEAFKGFSEMGCHPWSRNDDKSVRNVLNKAWERFWASPNEFATWEKAAVNAILSE